MFNLYSGKIFYEALDGIEKGIQLNGVRINNIRYADDTKILADSTTRLQTSMDHIAQHIQLFELNINVYKTKVISKNIITGVPLYGFNKTRIKRVK
jgi:hypothetical protein